MPRSNNYIKSVPQNTLFYGDNLFILREHVPSASVDLIYLDPPFNSNRTYNVLFKDEHGTDSEAQIRAFEDSWHWNLETEQVYAELLTDSTDKIARMIESLREVVGTNQMMAYLVMMTVRLIELHRILKPTGTIYLHCDTTASHYLKIVLDTIFGVENYRNELSWRRSNPKSNNSTNFANCRDIILRYSKTADVTFNKVFSEHDPSYIEKAYRYTDETGRRYRLLPLLNPSKDRPNLTYEFLGVKRVWRWTRERMQKAYEEGVVVQLKSGAVPQYKLYLDQSQGKTISNDWSDIPQASGNESLGYPTQKPLALLERIIQASSNPGDVILDPFCGCGTAVVAAEKLKRKWIGIDITHLGISTMKSRLKNSFPGIQFNVVGEPTDIGAAQQLADEDRYQFQWWALSLIQGAMPMGGQDGSREGKKGADKGIDGVLNFFDDSSNKLKRALIQVKSGRVNSSMIRDLVGTVQREKATMGVFVTLEPPTKDMLTEALSAGLYKSLGWKKLYPVIQIYTIDELLNGAEISIPPSYEIGRRAKTIKPVAEQRTFSFA